MSDFERKIADIMHDAFCSFTGLWVILSIMDCILQVIKYYIDAKNN